MAYSDIDTLTILIWKNIHLNDILWKPFIQNDMPTNNLKKIINQLNNRGQTFLYLACRKLN